MKASNWFDDIPVVGAMTEDEASRKLLELGVELPARLTKASSSGGSDRKIFSGGWWRGDPKPWQNTSHTFGYIAPGNGENYKLEVCHAGRIKADPALKNSRIKITFDRLRVADYPGKGKHRVLFDFYAQNQIPGSVEHLHFNISLSVQEGQQAAIIGYPVFVGLNVGSEGVAFKCFTVNVKNETDEAFLGFLESDAFQSGLKLTSVLQPAIAPLSEVAFGLTKSIAKRNQNVPVQEFYMGLDFSNMPTRARLAEGSYIAVQIPDTEELVWDWDQWIYDSSCGRIIGKNDPTRLIPYNFLIFSVSSYDGD